VTPLSSRAIPAHPGAREDALAQALAAVREEQRRFERLGFEEGQARLAHERRYWEFVAALYALPARTAPRAEERP
jgi:hypothetical protein